MIALKNLVDFLIQRRVRILFRQNASWQGTVLWSEGSQEERFRSALELALLLDSALEQVGERR